MKKCVLAVAVIFPFLVAAQWETEFPDIIEVAKPDTIFWVEDLEKFADSNKLEFLTDIPELHPIQGQVYLLANHMSYMAHYDRPEAYIAIRDKNKFRVWNFSYIVPAFSEVSIEDTVIINNRSLLVLIGEYNFMKHGYVPVMNTVSSCALSLILIDVKNNEVVFSNTFSESWTENYIWDYTIYDTAALDPPLTKEQLDAIYTYDTTEGQRYFIDPRGLDTTDMWEYPDTTISSYYYYGFSNNRIEFYKTNTGCNSDYPDAPKISPSAKPEFYYEFVPSQNTWIKKAD